MADLACSGVTPKGQAKADAQKATWTAPVPDSLLISAYSSLFKEVHQDQALICIVLWLYQYQAGQRPRAPKEQAPFSLSSDLFSSLLRMIFV